MLQALRRRLEQDEEGFTLIELMVVVLIIAILLAIAIPTFLGARTKAQNRGAQSNLRNGLTAARTFYTDNQTYSADAAAGMAAYGAIEPSLTWSDALATNATPNSVSDFKSAPAQLYLSAQSASGECFYIKDTGATATQYASSAGPTCVDPSGALNYQPAGFPA
jgi:type IV pilus assembly protein PilA